MVAITVTVASSPPPVVIDAEKEFEIEEVLSSKSMRKCLFYLIRHLYVVPLAYLVPSPSL